MNRGIARKLAREELQQYGLRLLAGRALSEGEVRARLARRALEAGDVDAVLEVLRGYGFLNDERFAEHFASARRDSGAVGSQRVLRDLRQRRVSGKVAEQAVAGAYEGSDEAELVRAWLQRKLRGVDIAEHLQDDKHLASLYRKLRYAGFGSAAVTRVLRQYSSRATELEDTEEDEGHG